MTNNEARELEILLNFLKPGKYSALLFVDAADTADFPERISEHRRTISSGETLKVKMAPEGGFAIELLPEN